MNNRHSVEVERVAGVRLKGADAAFTQNHIRVPFGEDVFRGEQPFLNRRRHAALEDDRLLRSTYLTQQVEIRHVPSP